MSSNLFSNGIIFNFGKPSGWTSVQFPISFVTEVFSICTGAIDEISAATVVSARISASSISKTGFSARYCWSTNVSTSDSSGSWCYIAIGS